MDEVNDVVAAIALLAPVLLVFALALYLQLGVARQTIVLADAALAREKAAREEALAQLGVARQTIADWSKQIDQIEQMRVRRDQAIARAVFLEQRAHRPEQDGAPSPGEETARRELASALRELDTARAELARRDDASRIILTGASA